MADKIDVARLAREADEYSRKHYLICENRADERREMARLRDEHFARLVFEEAAKVADDLVAFFPKTDDLHPLHIRERESYADVAAAIRARMP
jgi:hypothetical protein